MAALGGILTLAIAGAIALRPPPWVTLRIAEPEQPTFAFLYIAEARHFLDDERVKLTWVAEGTGRSSLQRLRSGGADLAVAYDFPVVTQALAGARFAVLASMHDSRRNTAILARRDRGIRIPDDLNHRAIGIVAGTASEYFASSFLTLHGIDMSSVEFRDLPAPSLVGELERGNVDAISTWNPLLWEGEEKLGDRATTFFADTYSERSLLVADRDRAEALREPILRLLHALRRAEDFVQHDPAEAQAITSRRLSLDRRAVAATWAKTRLDLKLDYLLVALMDQEGAWLRAYYPQRTRTAIPSFETLLYPEFLRTVDPEAVTVSSLEGGAPRGS